MHLSQINVDGVVVRFTTQFIKSGKVCDSLTGRGTVNTDRSELALVSGPDIEKIR